MSTDCTQVVFNLLRLIILFVLNERHLLFAIVVLFLVKFLDFLQYCPLDIWDP